MLTAQSFNYQAPEGADHLWVETLLFPVVAPEAPLYALVYTNVRPTLGVMWNQIMVCGSLTELREELLHYAENPHLPAPGSLTHIESPLGLTVRAIDPPRRWRIDYTAADGTEIHVDWEGLMEPFDIHDPNHSPQAGGVFDIHADLEPDKEASVGHGDMTGRIQGTMVVRGKEFFVDSIERMDRSWGVRDPMKAGKANHIVSANFGEDLAFHMICPWDATRPDGFTLTHGYVLEDGQVYGLTDQLTMNCRHIGTVCTALDMVVTDVRGESFSLRARANIGAPWIAAPTAVVHNALMEWDHEGRSGYGVVMGTRFLSEEIMRRGRFR